MALIEIDDIVELAAAPQAKALLAGHIVHTCAIDERLGRGDHLDLRKLLGRQIG